MGRDITTKTGEHMKGKPAPPKIRDAEQVPCPRVSKKGMVINHSIINLVRGESRCEFCRVTWVEIDQKIRDDAMRDAARRTREPRRKR